MLRDIIWREIPAFATVRVASHKYAHKQMKFGCFGYIKGGTILKMATRRPIWMEITWEDASVSWIHCLCVENRILETPVLIPLRAGIIGRFHIKHKNNIKTYIWSSQLDFKNTQSISSNNHKTKQQQQQVRYASAAVQSIPEHEPPRTEVYRWSWGSWRVPVCVLQMLTKYLKDYDMTADWFKPLSDCESIHHAMHTNKSLSLLNSVSNKWIYPLNCVSCQCEYHYYVIEE